MAKKIPKWITGLPTKRANIDNPIAQFSLEYNPQLQAQRMDATVIGAETDGYARLPKKGFVAQFPSRKAGRY